MPAAHLQLRPSGGGEHLDGPARLARFFGLPDDELAAAWSALRQRVERDRDRDNVAGCTPADLSVSPSTFPVGPVRVRDRSCAGAEGPHVFIPPIGRIVWNRS